MLLSKFSTKKEKKKSFWVARDSINFTNKVSSYQIKDSIHGYSYDLTSTPPDIMSIHPLSFPS